MKHLITIIIAFFLTGCSSDINVIIDPNKEICVIDHMKYWSEPLSEDIDSSGCIKVKANSAEIEQIKNWFEANSGNWKVINDTFKPRFTFNIEIYNLNLQKDSIIIKYQDKNKIEHQLWQPITDKSFDFIIDK